MVAGSVFLSDLTWTEAQSVFRSSSTILLPIGAIEAHGPHLPLDTDVVIAIETASRAARRMQASGMTCLVAPPIAYGVSYVGASFPGTIPLAAATVSQMVHGIIIELARQGAFVIVVVNAHLEPAHIGALQEGIARARELAEIEVVFPDQREDRWAVALSEEFRRGARHAGCYETSLMLAAAPDRVRRDLLATLPAVEIDLPARLRAGASTFAEAGGTQAYFGDPASATADEGERLYDALVEMIMTALSERSASPRTGER